MTFAGGENHPNHRIPKIESLSLEHFLGNGVEFESLFSQFGGTAALGAMGIVMSLAIGFENFNRVGNLFFAECKRHGAERAFELHRGLLKIWFLRSWSNSITQLRILFFDIHQSNLCGVREILGSGNIGIVADRLKALG